MTDKEFVLSIYPDATYVVLKREGYDYLPMAIMVQESNGFREIGYNVGWGEDATWSYARKDLEYEMLRRMER